MVFELAKKALKRTKAATRGYFGPLPGEIYRALLRSTYYTGRTAIPKNSKFGGEILALFKAKPEVRVDEAKFIARASRLAAASATRAVGCPTEKIVPLMKWSRDLIKKKEDYLNDLATEGDMLALIGKPVEILGRNKGGRFLSHYSAKLKMIHRIREKVFPYNQQPPESDLEGDSILKT